MMLSRKKRRVFIVFALLLVGIVAAIIIYFFNNRHDTSAAKHPPSPHFVTPSATPSHDMYAPPSYPVKSVANNGIEGWNSRQKLGYSLNEVPEQYRAAVTIPEFDPANLKNSPYAGSWKQGQCTELTWAYMDQLWSTPLHSKKDGGVLYEGYGEAGGYVTDNPTVGYGFSVPKEVVGNQFGHTGVVMAVYPDGSFLTANYNMEAVDVVQLGGKRTLSYILFPGAKDFKFFSGLGEPKFSIES